ncbi:glycosyltransferase family 2 protein [Lyngbya sp. PCC 8106]|uniref:glycosyltransferase family 2 protein n=1 Tax=Lyngbya sp. (strain PCC 8106) TaxID=313612 RepID=UPI0000EAD44E|nr:glycosyltransferase family 2 protein [Lyngbya sp. PCC 8106]EAW33811.1 hypothetical protein L8106_18097 [Lyngbya sp. PCC 8106]
MVSNLDSVVLSVVIPCYNEEPNLDDLFTRLMIVLDQLHLTYEIICVDDGSRDNTLKRLIEYHHSNPMIKVVNFSRNFGKEIALTAGIEYAIGEAVIPIDADLQDPPELIGDLILKWQDGYDVVYCKRRSRQGETWLKQKTAGAFYRIISKMTPVPIPRDTGDFRLMDRRVVEALKRLPERHRFMKGLFSWVGFKQIAIEYDRPPRSKGETKWNYWQLWNFALDGITSFSSLPLKVWSYIGLLISLLAFLYATFLILRTLILGIDVPGYASIMVVTLFLGGVQLVSLGVIGEYLSRVHDEVKRRPLYIVRDCYGFEKDIPKN